jgi:hypothetical protein
VGYSSNAAIYALVGLVVVAIAAVILLFLAG